MIERYSLPNMTRVWSPENRVAKWLQVEIAVCEARAELGEIPSEAVGKIAQATCDLGRMREIEARVRHEVTAFLAAVAESIGDEARYVHYGLTSSDILDTALALQVREAADILRGDLNDLVAALTDQAIRHKHTPMIGRTHGVHAEPITFGFKLAVWIGELRRSLSRLDSAAEQMSAGKISGAVGTHATVSPQVEDIVCRELGLQVAAVSTQIVQRDRHAYFLATLAVIGATLEKMATEIRSLQRTEVLEVEEPFSEGQQGSSAMPHKRNPELCERVCGLARVLRGHSVTALENVALWHERDISHSSTERIIFPESCGLLDYMLVTMTKVISGLLVYPESMMRNLHATGGLIYSQRVLLALVEKGLSRSAAYDIVQRNAMRAWKERGSFFDCLRQEPEVSRLLTDGELSALADYHYHLRHVEVAFERLGLGHDSNPLTGAPS